MKELKKIALLGLLLVFALGCNIKNKEEHSQHEHEEGLHYTCSMDPQVKEDKPGKCPICHMELTPMKNDERMSDEISLSDQQIKLGNITTMELVASQSNPQESYTGVLTINQEQLKTIAAKAMGRIEKLYFKATGDFVQKNQAVYQLYSEDIAIAKQDYLTAYKQLSMPGDFGKNAKNILASARQKLLFFGLSNAQIEAIKTQKEVSPYTTFYSSYSGTISEIPVTEGNYVMEGTPVIKLANLKSLWLETQVNINYAKNLRLGQMAQVSFVDFPNQSVNAKVSFINPEINPDSRLLLIRMEVPNPNLDLKPGMQAIARLKMNAQKGLFVPVDAVIRDENATFIWVEKSHGVYEDVMVETGIESDGMIEIVSAIDSDKKVVVTGAYAINSEYKFRKGKNPMEGMKM